MFAIRIPILKRVPKSCLALWGTALVRILALVHLNTLALSPDAAPGVYNRCERAYIELEIMGKCVLNPSPRRGKKHVNLIESHMKGRF